MEAKDLFGWTTFHYAVMSEPATVVALHLDRGADVEVKDANGRTPLHHAASLGRAKVVALLLDRRADIDAKAADGDTPLHEAAMEERNKVAKILVDRGADIEARNAYGRTALYRAALDEQLKVVNLLTGLGANVDAKDANGDTPLHIAALRERVKLVSLLVDLGADVDAKDGLGNTALHWAVRLGRAKVVALLLDHGADLEARDANGDTPLHHAVTSKHSLLAILLLDRGADVDARDAYGKTALHEAAISDHALLAALLLDRGANIDAKDANDSPPLHDAVMSRSTRVVALLLDGGADIDSFGEYLLLHAADEDEDMASLLRDRGIAVAPTNEHATNSPQDTPATGDVETGQVEHGPVLAHFHHGPMDGQRVAVGCLLLLGLIGTIGVVGAVGGWLLTPSRVAPENLVGASVSRNEGARRVRPVLPLRDRPVDEAEVRAIRPTTVTLARWEDPIAPTIRATRTLLGRGEVVLLRTRYSDGTSQTEELIERPSGKPNERRFEVEPDNDQSEYITVSDSGVVRWFAWDGTNFLTQRASRIHADFLALGANPAQRDCIPKQLSPTAREVVTLYEQLQDFKDDPAFAVLGFSVGGPYHQWMEDATRVAAESSRDEGARQLDQLGFTAGDVMNLGLSYLNPEVEEEKRNVQHTERRVRAGLALATCDASASPQN